MNFFKNYYLNVLLIGLSTKNDRCQDVTRTKSGIEKRTQVQKRKPWKKSHKIFKTDIYLQYLQTYTWVSASKQSTWAHRKYSVHFVYKIYIHFLTRALNFANPSQNAKNVFVFGGSLISNNFFQVAIFIEVCFALHIGVVVLVFQFLFCTFLQYPFSYHCMIWT